MKKLQVLVVAALVVGSASLATAQDPQPQGQGQGQGGRAMVTRGMGMMMQGITLTAEQQVKVDSLAARTERERQAVIADQSIEGPAKRTKIMELMNKQQEEIKTILTPEQKTVFEKNIADMQARRQQGGGQRPPTA